MPTRSWFVIAIANSYGVADINVTPVLLEVLCNKPTVALVWLVLTAEQTAISDYLSWNRLLDASLFNGVRPLNSASLGVLPFRSPDE